MNNCRSLNPMKYILFFLVIILPSPILYSLGLSVRFGSLIICLFSIGIFIMHGCYNKSYNIKVIALYFVFVVMGFGIFTAFHYMNYVFIIILSCLIAYSFLYNVVWEDDISEFLNVSSIIFLVLEIGAIIGFVYAQLGGEPILVIKNPDGRENGLFLTTFSNARIGRFIRPSGIYDEPGAFSFFIISISALRVYYKKNPLFTFTLLILGIVTMSLTHILCTIILLIPLRKQLSFKNKLIFDFCSIIFISIILILFFDVFDKLVFSRLKFDTSTGKIKGDNRTTQIDGCLRSIKDNGALFGIYLLSSDQILKKYGVIGENPLSLLTINGLFNSIAYYIFLITSTLCCILGKNKFFFICILALFIQRPYQSQLGYSFFFIHFFYLSIKELKKNNYKYIFRRYDNGQSVDNYSCL